MTLGADARPITADEECVILRRQLSEIRRAQEQAFIRLHDRIRDLEEQFVQATGRLPEGSTR